VIGLGDCGKFLLETCCSRCWIRSLSACQQAHPNGGGFHGRASSIRSGASRLSLVNTQETTRS
jgi:hypothetical protein